jgi:antitoxin component YwqK of YwqJK toxin-antitoxin module
MTYKIHLLSFVLAFITITSFSQTKRYLYYFDKDFNSTKKSKSIFHGIGVYENGLVEVRVYNSLNNDLVYIEHYTDSSLQLSDGFFQSYHRNASREWEGNYLKGKEEGLWQKWDSLGHIIDSSVYNNGEKVMEAHFGYHKNGILSSFIVTNIKADQLQKTYYDSSGKVVSEVSFTGQNGINKVYKNGTMVRADSLFTRDEIEASFPGGPAAWTQYIQKEVERNQNEFTSNDYGTCWVKFIVGIDGKITDVVATTMQGTKLAEIAVSVIRNAPKWKAAIQYGRPVNAYRLQPVGLMKTR